MSLTTTLLFNFGLVAGIMSVLWLASLPIRNASIVDIFWGIGFVILVWVSFYAAATLSPRSLLISTLTTLWGLRLSLYLAWRNLGKGEDYRYREMREKSGERFPLLSLWMVFWLQGILMWLVSFPLQTAHFGAAPLGWVDAMGVALWSVGWFFESVGRLANGSVQDKSRQPGEGDGPRTVAVHTASELFWRFPGLVGFLFDCTRKRCLVDPVQSDPHVGPAAAHFRCDPARTIAETESLWLRRIRRAHECFFPPSLPDEDSLDRMTAVSGLRSTIRHDYAEQAPWDAD